MDIETGTKPVEGQPVVMPTTETGTKVEPVMPTGIPLVDDLAVEKDGQKVVPFDSYKAEKEKRQELEERVRKFEEQAKPTEITQEPETIDWGKILGTPTATVQPTASTPSPAPTSPNWMQEFNDSLAEQRSRGDEIGAYARLRQFERQYENNMKRTAREWVKGYDELPLSTVTDEEVFAFQQNPEALRGVLAKIKGGKQPTQTIVNPVTTNDGKETWDQLQTRLKREGADEYARSLANQSGVSGESARAGSQPIGEELVPDEGVKKYLEGRGIPKEKWPQYLKALKKEQELTGRF